MTVLTFPPARPPLMEVVRVRPKLYRAHWRDAHWRIGVVIWESESRIETLRRA
jgi:hypothetical protein